MVMMIGAVVFPFQVRSLLHHQPEAALTDDPEQYSRRLTEILLHGITSKREQ